MVERGVGALEVPEGVFLYRTVRYGAEGFSHRYFLVAAVLPKELEGALAPQRQRLLTVSVVLSLSLLLIAFALAHYRACCRKRD